MHEAAVVPSTKPAIASLSPTSAVLRAVRSVRAHWIAYILCSVLLLVPCFWHRHIEACDLGSHLYTAWLTQAVSQGLIPGLHLQRQFTNIFFDVLLSSLFPYVGATGAERIAVSFCVLVFFWGSFAFASAAARMPAWKVAPLLAMITYGAIFHWGFFNCYLSVGFSFFGLALITTGAGGDFVLLPLLVAVAAVAHPMGAACLVVLGMYVAALRRLSAGWRFVASGAMLGVAFAARGLLVRHAELLPREIHRYWLLGADQLIVFGRPFFWIAVAAGALCLGALMLALIRIPRLRLAPWLQFYVVIALVVCFAPGGLYNHKTFGMMGYLPDRGSLYSAVALALLIGCCRPRLWFTAGCTVLALVFFGFVYRDTGILERRGEKVAQLVRGYEGRRVIGMIQPVPGWRIDRDHSLDRACIGHCYAYDNYEPNSGQFRLRADADNRVVESDADALDAMEDGSYVVQQRDLPLYQVYQCDDGIYDLCATELHAGEKNGDQPDNVGGP